MINLARHQYPNSSIAFLTEITPDDLILYADENLISQVMTNLLKNAVQAIESENKDKKRNTSASMPTATKKKPSSSK